jgi:hypothetical protein
VRSNRSTWYRGPPARGGQPAKIWSRVPTPVHAGWQPRLITRAGSTAPETMLCTVSKNPVPHFPCYLALNQAGIRGISFLEETISEILSVHLGSPALLMIQDRQPAHRSPFSKRFSIVPNQRKADIIESAGQPSPVTLQVETDTDREIRVLPHSR